MEYKNCKLCPRECGANRTNGEMGFCGCGDELLLARAALHKWEEPCISGEGGSGTVFFSGCNLHCVYCQNIEISRRAYGKHVSVEQLSEIFLELQSAGAENINLVTPTHYAPSIKKSLLSAKEKGLSIPVVYNTSGYEKAEILRELAGVIDIYLTDYKYVSSALSKKYSHAENYSEYAEVALDEMVRQCTPCVFDERGLMKRGVVVRHLLLPECGRDSKKLLSRLHGKYGDNIYISIMRQYTPMLGIGAKYPELDRHITDKEYERILAYAESIGIVNGYIQDEGCESESFIPPFNSDGI